MKRLIIGVALLVACGGGSDAPPPDAFQSICGEPGDQGNELGIGQFCMFLEDCADTVDARLCSNIGDAETWFCTRTCPEGDDTVCGTGAACTCGTGGCGCTPTECL